MSLTVLIKGPLSVDEIKAIIAVVQAAEQERPDETFHVLVDSPEGDERMDQIEEWMRQRPIPPGYGRIFLQHDLDE